jgi:hypothetical protein
MVLRQQGIHERAKVRQAVVDGHDDRGAAAHGG